MVECVQLKWPVCMFGATHTHTCIVIVVKSDVHIVEKLEAGDKILNMHSTLCM